MNSALDSLYQDLLRQVDDNDQAKELTAEEKAENFLKEKQLVLYKLEEESTPFDYLHRIYYSLLIMTW